MRKEIDVMRVIRIPPLGKLVIEIGDKRYERISELKDARMKRRVITAIGELMGFAGGYEALVDEGVAPPLSAQTPTGSLQSKAASLKEQQQRFLDTLAKEKSTPQKSVRSRSGPPPVPPERTPSHEKATSLVDQIDHVLQRHLQENHELRERSIHLIQSIDGGVNIKVDDKIYNHPSEIEEKLIRLTIKQALKEWEAS